MIKDPLDPEEFQYSQEEIGGYEQAFIDFTQLYCNATDARDIMHTYLRSAECRKTPAVTCKEHADRILILMKYTQKLEGSSAPLSRVEKLTILLHSFPSAWIESYGIIHMGIQENTTVQHIVDHMSCHEHQANKKSNKNNNKQQKRSNNSNSNKKHKQLQKQHKQLNQQNLTGGSTSWNKLCNSTRAH